MHTSISIVCTIKWIQSLQSNTNNCTQYHLLANRAVLTSIAIQHYSFICTPSNCFKYCFVIQIIHLWHTVKEFQVLLFNIDNYIEHYSFISTQLNGSKYCDLNKVKLATLVKGYLKAPFSIATTPWCRVLLHSLDGSTLPLILTL